MNKNVEIIKEYDTKETAEVSVVISLYNYESYIVETLESVKNQSLEKIDLIVVDDCSSDNSLALVSAWFEANKERFNRFLVLHNTHNQKLPTTRNNGLSFVNTEYVFTLDADNLLYPRCLESLLRSIKNSGADFAYCYLERFGGYGGIQNTARWNPNTLRYGNTIDAMVLHRVETMRKLGGYSVMPIQGWEDFEYWFKVAGIGGWGVRVPEILARYRVHFDSMIHTETSPKVHKAWEYIKEKHPDFFKD